MTVLALTKYLEQGREIEFSINEKSYLTPLCYNGMPSAKYRIFDNQTREYIFTGSRKEILEYSFSPCICFRDAINQFAFEYIL